MIGFRRIDRYVIREMIGPVVLSFTFFTFLLLMNQFLLVAERSISKNLGWDLTFRLVSLALPDVVILTVPMAVLLGCLVGIGRLSSDSEWVALQASGLGIWVLARPLLFVGLGATLVSGFIYWEVAPRAQYLEHELSGQVALASNMAADLKPRTFYSNLENVVLFVDDLVPGTLDGQLRGVLLHQKLPDRNDEELVFARSGSISAAGDAEGSLVLELRDGVAHTYSETSSDAYRRSTFEEYAIFLPAPEYLKAFLEKPQKSVRDMRTTELIAEARVAAAVDDDTLRRLRTRQAWVQIHMRFALPVASTLFALLALPLGIRQARSGKGAGFALSIVVILIYRVLFTTTRDQAIRGTIPVEAGVWTANLAILVWFLWGIFQLRRSAGERGGLLAGLRRLSVSAWRLVGRVWRRAPSPGPATNGAAPQGGNRRSVFGSWLASGRLVGLLDTYITAHFLRVMALALVASYALFAVVELNDLLEGVFKYGRPITMVGEYFLVYAPGMVQYTLPVACMAGAIVAITLYSRTGELTAMKASGMSARRVTVPILFVTVVFCGSLFIVQDRIAPHTNQKRQEIKDYLLDRSPRTYGVPVGGRWVFGSDGSHLYHYRHYDPEERQFGRLSVFALDRKASRILDHRHAETATWNGSAWELENSWYRYFPADDSPGTYRTPVDTESFRLDPPSHFEQRTAALASGDKLADQMSLRDLRREIESLDQSGYDTTRLRVSYFGKYAQALTPLVMVLLGLPFAFRIGRKGSLYGVGVSLLLVIVYWATFAVFRALGLETLLPPLLAAWAPTVLYGLLGTSMLLSVRT